MNKLQLITGTILLTSSLCLSASDVKPKLWYTFENGMAEDQSGNGYHGTLKGSAKIREFGDKSTLYLGYDKGYLDMGENVGSLISSMKDFTISTYVYIPEKNSLNSLGNFIASFSNSENILSNASGYMMLSAKVTGYCVTTTDYRAEQSLIKDEIFPTGQWKHIAYTQTGTTGKLYIDGDSVKTSRISIYPRTVGKTKYNWIGRSCYSGDSYLNNAYIDDFKIYDEALSSLDIKGISSSLSEYKTLKEPPFQWESKGNPVITHKYTADAASMVYNDTLWIFAGEDYTGGQTGYRMHNWVVFSTTDMKTFTEYPTPLSYSDFSWSSNNAWASHVVEKNGKFYFYTSSNTTGIGVAVSDRPEGPYKDALNKPLLTTADCHASSHSWACIDPAVFIDDDGEAYIFWGNSQCYYAKLKSNMIEIDGSVKHIDFDDFGFTEAPWVHKRDGIYYLTYASGFPEKISYATSHSINGPWTYKGILNEIAGNSNTNHQAISEYKGNWYFVYHNGAMQQDGSSYSRSVCIDYLYYNEDGSMKRIQMTSEGVDKIEESGDTKIVVNQKSGSTLKVYPNPVENILKIDYKETSDHLEIDIYDIEGKKQMTKKIKTFPAEINVSKLSKGSYIVRCSNKQGFNESMNIIIK